MGQRCCTQVIHATPPRAASNTEGSCGKHDVCQPGQLKAVEQAKADGKMPWSCMGCCKVQWCPGTLQSPARQAPGSSHPAQVLVRRFSLQTSSRNLLTCSKKHSPLVAVGPPLCKVDTSTKLQGQRRAALSCPFWMHKYGNGLILYPLLPPCTWPPPATGTKSFGLSRCCSLAQKLCQGTLCHQAPRCPLPTRACRANKGGFLSNKRSKGMKCRKSQLFLLVGRRCLRSLCGAHLVCKALPLVPSPIHTLSTREMGDQSGRRRREEQALLWRKDVKPVQSSGCSGSANWGAPETQSPLEEHLAGK